MTNTAHTDDLSDNAIGSRTKGLELDLRSREFEINQLTQRNNFFMIFQGVMIAGLVQSQGTAAPTITVSMCALGVATSILQIGMAGGAKYWQSRWEASTRSSEIAIVLALIKRGEVPVQTFTHDSSLLNQSEKDQIIDWNTKNPNDPLIDDVDFIKKVVLADINGSRRRGLRWGLDWWVRYFAISPKWSVSRIPIWIGAALLVFWSTIFLNCISIKHFDLNQLSPTWIKLTPLKTDSPSKEPVSNK